MSTSQMAPASVADGTSAEKSMPQHRRKRKALSCVPCKARKIRCDRNVPRCSSCVARGIERTCKWGDERDDDDLSHADRARHRRTGSDKARVAKRARSSSFESISSQSSSSDEGGYDEPDRGESAAIDTIVSAVLKKIKRGRKSKTTSSKNERRHSTYGDGVERDHKRTPRRHASPSEAARQSSSTNSIAEILEHRIRPSLSECAYNLPITAFGGSHVNHSFFSKNANRERNIDSDVIRLTLQYLPSRSMCDRLLDIFFNDMQPYRSIFNQVLLKQQYEEFWSGVKDLGIIPSATFESLLGRKETLVQTSTGRRDFFSSLPRIEPLHPSPGREFFASQRADQRDGQRQYFLCSQVRQGLIALLLAIIDAATRSMKLDDLVILGICPANASEQMAIDWSECMNELSLYHMSLSNYYQQPTLWTLQTLFLNQGRWLDVRTAGRSVGARGTLVSLAVSMGLNKLGSGYDDLEETEDVTIAADENPLFPSQSYPKLTAACKTQFLGDSRHTTTRGIFEHGNIALRELGRKIWCSIISNEWLAASHIDHFYCAHDNVCFSSPPLPIDDDDILSDKAPYYIAKARLGLHKPSETEIMTLYMAAARAARTQVDLENRHSFPLHYDDVLFVDAQMQQVLNAVPRRLQVEHCRSEAIACETPQQQHYLRESRLSDSALLRVRSIVFQASYLQDHLHFRRLRLHRQHLGRGLKDTRYRTSVVACLEAAEVILRGRVAVDPYNFRLYDSFVMVSHLFHAALVLQLALLYEMDRRRAQHKLRREGLTPSKDLKEFRLDNMKATVDQFEIALTLLRKSESGQFAKLFPALMMFLRDVKEFMADEGRQAHHQSLASAPQREITNQQHDTRRSFSSFSKPPQQPADDRNRPTYRQSLPSESDPRRDSHTDAATILASIPSLAYPAHNYPSSTSTSTQQYTPPSVSGPSPSGTLSEPAQRNSTPWSTSSSTYMADSSYVPPLPAAVADPSTGNAPIDNTLGQEFWSLEALFPNYALGEVDLLSALEKSIENGGWPAAAPSAAGPVARDFNVNGTGYPPSVNQAEGFANPIAAPRQRYGP